MPNSPVPFKKRIRIYSTTVGFQLPHLPVCIWSLGIQTLWLCILLCYDDKIKSFSLRKEQRLRVFEKKGAEVNIRRKEMTAGWSKLQNDQTLLKVQCRVRKYPPLHSTLSQTNPINILVNRLRPILKYAPILRSPKKFVPFPFPNKIVYAI